jgi:hypothetical protein
MNRRPKKPLRVIGDTTLGKQPSETTTPTTQPRQGEVASSPGSKVAGVQKDITSNAPTISTDMKQLPNILASSGRTIVTTYLTPTDTLVHTRNSEGSSVFVVCPKHFSFTTAPTVTLGEAKGESKQVGGAIPMCGEDIEYGLEGNRYREVVISNAPLRKLVAQANRLRACLGKFGLVMFYDTWVLFVTAHDVSIYTGSGGVDGPIYYPAIPLVDVRTYLSQVPEFEEKFRSILCGGVNSYVRTLSDFIQNIDSHVRVLQGISAVVKNSHKQLRDIRASQKHLVNTLIEKKKTMSSIRDAGARSVASNLVAELMSEISMYEDRGIKLDQEMRTAALVVDRLCYENMLFIKNVETNNYNF